MNHLEPEHKKSLPLPVEEEFNTDEEIIEPRKTLLSNIFGFFGNMISSKKKIGELNGTWAAMFKLIILSLFCIIPTFIGWMVWVSSNVYENKSFIEMNKDNLTRIELLEKTDVSRADIINQMRILSNKMDNLPPPDWRRRIENLETKYEIIDKGIVNLDKENSTDHTKITTLLQKNTELLTEIRNKQNKE